MIEETLTRSLSEAATVPTFVVNVDPAGELVLADLNPACERATGLRREDVVGRRTEDISGLTRAGAMALRGMWQRCLQAGTVVTFDEELELPVGIRFFHTLLLPVHDAAGNVERIVGVIRDITEQEQASRDLQRSNDLLRAIVEAAPTAIIGLDLDGNVHTVWNPAAEKMLGWSAREAMGHPLPSVPMESQEEFSRFRERIRGGMTLDGVEVRRQKRDGTPVDYSIYASPLHDAEGRIAGNIAVLVDVTERKRTEAAMHRLNRELRALSTCNQTLMRAEDEQTLLNDVCRIICEEAGYRLAWVGYAEHDDAKSVRPVAWAGVDSGYVAQARLSWSDDTEHGRGPAGIAIRSGEVVHVQDFATDPRVAPWRESALQRGYRSGIVLPLTDAEAHVFGVLLTCHEEANVITPEEIRLMEELADDLAFGVTALRTRAERQQAQDELRAAEVRFRTIVDHATDAFFLFDDHARVVDANQQACLSLGYAKEELIGMTPTGFDAAADPSFLEVTWARLAVGETVTFETCHRRKDGSEFPVEVRTRLFHDGREAFGVSLARDITERKRAEQERLDHVRFLESMDRVNRAIQGVSDLDQGMSAALDATLSVFDCDRAYLLYPCDPDAPSWFCPVERTRPEHPGVLTLNLEMPSDSEVAETFRVLLDSEGPVRFGPESEYPLPAEVAERFGIRSFLAMALYPKGDRPWQFGIHQCSYSRVWTREDLWLFQQIGRRLGDALTTLLAFRSLRESEARLAEAQHIARVGHWHHDIEADRITGSDEALRIFGVPREGSGVSFVQLQELAHPDDRQALAQVEAAVLRGDACHELEYRTLSPDGDARFVHARWRMTGDESGRPRHVFGTVQDVTERRLAEEALRKSNERFRDLYENAPNAYFSVGADGVIRRCNRRAEELLGYQVGELEGRPVMEAYADTQYGRGKAAQVLQRFQAGETVRDEELQMKRADGRPVWVSLTVDAVRDAEGRVVESRSMAVDITERKRGEQIMQARVRLMEFAPTHSLGELLQATLDEAEALTGSSIGFYHTLGADQETLTLQAWSTNTLEKMCTAEGKGLHYSIDQAGVWVDCVRERRPVIHNAYAALPHRKGMPEGHAPVTRELVTPVFRGDAIVAILGVGNKPTDYDQADLTTTGMLADLAWGIAERKRADEALRLSERTKAILSQIAGVFLTVPDNEMYEKVLTLVRQVLRSELGIFGFIGENGDLVIPRFSRDVWSECQVAGKSVVFPPALWGESLWGRAIRERRAFISDGPFHAPEGHIRVDHFLTVPIVFRDETIGLISVANAPQSYTEKDKDLLETIAAYISPILNARLERDRQEERRKSAEESLRKLSQAVEQSPASIVITDTAGNIEYVNPKFSQLTGYAREEAIGKNPRILKSGETPAEEYQRLWDTITHGRVWRGEFHNKKKNGELYWESASISPVTDALGDIKHFVAVKEDITARKRAEGALAESEAKVRSILDNVGIGVALISPKMEILELNHRMREWFPAVDPGQHPICYRAYNDPPREAVCDYCPTCRTLRDGLVHEATTETPRAGVVRNYRIVSSPVFDPSGQVTAAIEMVEDITERLSLESQLRHAQKMEAVGRLAGGVAHDFNNMLGVIIGYTEHVLGQVDPAGPLSADLEEVLVAAERSADLTGKLLAFGRKQTVAPKVLDLNETVEGMLKMLRRLIGEDIDVAWLPGARVWPIEMDPSQIDQILANLCVNARDAIAGVGKVTIETQSAAFDDAYCAEHPEATPGDYVLLGVSDDGCGMDKDTLSRVFEPFFTTKEEGKGTGLGLATVYGIVKQNNGFIDVYSEPGHGTTFKLYLPRHTSTTQEMRTEGPAAEIARGDESILLVEDEPAMLNVARQMLEGFGYRVLAASTPGEAIRLAQEDVGEIHLLITDVVMPEMNGRDLARKLISLHPEIRILFMSGYTGNVIAHHGVLDEGVTFVAKPFSTHALAAKVRQVLNGE